MSYTAIWRNRNKPRKCTAPHSCCGSTIHHDRKDNLVQYGTFRLIRNPDGRKNEYGGYSDFYHLYVPRHGEFMTEKEADQLDIESGNAVPYFRNACRFVMSRAARKRGLTTNDFLYNNRKKEHDGQARTI